jgi:HlyD family secretion protein
VKKFLIILIAIIIAATAVFIILKYVPFGKVDPADLEISEVEIGSVMSTRPAEGTVEPESEVLILSPASSIIRRIVKDVGSKVNAGEAIIILDPTPVQEQIEKINDQLEVKRNSLSKNRLNAKSIKVDLDYNVEVKKLKIASIKSELADQEQLLEVGGISPAKFDKTKQELTLAEKDLETINERNRIRLLQLLTDDEGLNLQIVIQEKELANQELLLEKMIIRAPSAGIILSLDGRQGEKVNRDKQLISMSNLSNFKILAIIDEDHSEYIRTGVQVVVNLDGEELEGQVGTVSPVIKNKNLEFDVYLEKSNHWKLRPNLTLPIKIVIDRVDSVKRVKFGPSLEHSSNFDIYKVEGDAAMLQNISTGLKGDNYIEIVEGAIPGDQLIISDVSLFRNKDHVVIY